MPSLHSLYGLRVILIVSAYVYMDKNYVYMDKNCFGLVCVVSNWLRVSSKGADSSGWVVADGLGWLWMVSGGFGWFAVLVVTIQKHPFRVSTK